MKKIALLISFIFLFLFNGVAFAQLPHTFTNIAHINDGGWANGVVIGTNGTVFLANDDDGLRAYSYNGISFTNTAHINDGGEARSVIVAANGTIFLANDDNGLRAYTYSGVLGVNDENTAIPNDYVLSQNYPNPFNPTTTISYSVPKQSKVSLKVFNVLGKEVKTLVNEQQQIGNYKIQFDASSLPSGIYLYQLQSSDFVETKKLILLR